MLVYGDHPEHADPRARIGELRQLLPNGDQTELLIRAGELAQGLIDADFHARGFDARSPLADAAMTLVMQLARGERDPGACDALLALELPEEVTLKRAEGFAFYALHPELYVEAARQLPRDRPTRVIGIRSIGTTLAAVVANVVGDPRPVTVRPGGHPFRRELALAPGLARELLADPDAQFAIVDEGPGLSGSSFGAVIDFLEGRGVPLERIHVLPSHAGELGPEGSERHRQRWSRLQRHVADFEAVIRPRLAAWFEPLVGPIQAIEELSGGAWRARVFGAAPWPASNVQQERRKYLLHTARGAVLARFVGLGAVGPEKLELARRLHHAGFVPEPLGVRSGYLLERWVDARPLPLAGLPRARLIERVGAYLAFRARAFPAGPSRGASLEELLKMARFNSGLKLEGLEGVVARSRPRPTVSDGRLHAWEWLVTDGEVLKADAVDHHAGHDLVGCQDVTWDLAGAITELDLAPDEALQLVAATGLEVDRELLRFMRVAYLAFQLGAQAMAAQALASMPEEARRLREAEQRYRRKLTEL